MNIKKLNRNTLKSLEGKYIFHGSPTLFDVCKPHQAKDYNGNSDNEKFAIYGSMELDFSVLFAFDKQPNNQCRWRVVHIGEKCIGELDKNTYIPEDAKGYLYMFDKKYFKQIKSGRQYICETPIEPNVVTEVEYKDYKDLFQVVDFSKDFVQ